MTDREGLAGSSPQADAQRLSASVTLDISPEDPDAADTAEVRIQDANHPGVDVSLKYADLYAPGGFRPVGFSVTNQEAGKPSSIRLGPGVIKDFPIATWDRLAQAAVNSALIRWRDQREQELMLDRFSRRIGEFSLMSPSGRDRESLDAIAEETATPLHVPMDRMERAREMVLQARPDLNPDAGRGAARSWNGLVKLASALDEHTSLLASGTPDAVAEMAESHGVAPATVRTWLHRARQAGLTATASSGIGVTRVEGLPDAWFAGAGRTRSLTAEEMVTPERQTFFNEIGRSLREAREAAEATVEGVSAATRIRVPIIQAMERGDFTLCAGPVYARGHIRIFGKEVGLSDRAIEDLIDLHHQGHGESPLHRREALPLRVPESKRTSQRKRDKKSD